MHVEPELQNLMDQDGVADSNLISQVQDQDQLTESSPIFKVLEVSNAAHLQGQELNVSSDDADQSGPQPKRNPTPDAVKMTPEPGTRGGEVKALDYYIDIAAVLDYPEEHHTKTEDGNDPSLDESSDEGSLGLDPPLGFIANLAICVILRAVGGFRLIMWVQTH